MKLDRMILKIGRFIAKSFNNNIKNIKFKSVSKFQQFGNVFLLPIYYEIANRTKCTTHFFRQIGHKTKECHQLKNLKL